MHVSVYQAAWSTPDATITYDSYLADYNNALPPGSPRTLDLVTGVFTCPTPGCNFFKF